MKKYIITNDGSIGFDTETEETFNLPSCREAISRIIMVDEPMEIVIDRYGKKYTLSAKKDDIVIMFYEEYFPMPAIVVKNKDWAKNIKDYNKKVQKEKEEWAAKKKLDANCSCADCETSCIG